jgi:hypothetical protein
VSLDASPLEPDTASRRDVPLTMAQRTRLLKDCLPAALFIVALIVVPPVLQAANGSSPSNAFYAFMALVIAFCLYSAQQRARDLLSGVAVVEEDLLIRTGRSKRGSHGWSQLERLGRMRCTPTAYAQARPGVRHVVTYSPASRIVWSLEPVV